MTSRAAVNVAAFVLVTTALLQRWPAAHANRRGEASDHNSVCPSSSRDQQYLESLYRCRPGEFKSVTLCDGDQAEVRCSKSQVIRIRSAVYGWSSAFPVDKACPANHGYDRGCPLSCVLQSVASTCDGRRRCAISAHAFSSGCPSGAAKFLSVLHTCVTKNVNRALESNGDVSSDLLANPCGTGDYDGDDDHWHVTSTTSPTPTTPTTTTSTTTRTTTTTAATTTATTTTAIPFYWYERSLATPDDRMRYVPFATPRTSTQQVYQNPYQPGASAPPGRAFYPSLDDPSMDDDDLTSPRHGEVVNDNHRPHASYFSLSDWIWTWQFANDNKEKFVLYMVIGLCIGTIAILVAILFHFAIRQQSGGGRPCASRRFKPGRSDVDASVGLQSGNVGSSCGSPTWRDGAGPGLPESESSTGDDRTLHDADDVEMSSFNHHVDSLPRRSGGGGGGGGAGQQSQMMMTGQKCQHHQQMQQQQQQHHQQQPSMGSCSAAATMGVVGRPGSSLGAPVTTATINRSYATVTATGRCNTPGGPPNAGPMMGNGGMTMGHVPNGYGGGGPRYSAMPSVVGQSSAGSAPPGAAAAAPPAVNGSMSRGPMIGSLGRSFAGPGNQYGPPGADFGYQFDMPDAGSRTLQPVQHYYG